VIAVVDQAGPFQGDTIVLVTATATADVRKIGIKATITRGVSEAGTMRMKSKIAEGENTTITRGHAETMRIGVMKKSGADGQAMAAVTGEVIEIDVVPNTEGRILSDTVSGSVCIIIDIRSQFTSKRAPLLIGCYNILSIT
jgi:hypothetical protein